MKLRHTRLRAGFTLIELLVVIAIIGVLAALLLPGIQSARQAAKRTECLNNMKNIGIAFQNHQAQKQYLPPSGRWDVTDATKYAEWANLGTLTDANASTMRYSWCLDLLPFLEHSDIYDQWDFSPPTGNSTTPGGFYGSYWATSTTKLPVGGNAKLAGTPIKVFTCPSDPTLTPGRGNLSYVVNGGFRYHWRYDFNADGTTGQGLLPITGSANIKTKRFSDNVRNMGLLFLQTSSASQTVTTTGTVSDQRNVALEGIKDGTTSTVMLSENINTGYGALWSGTGSSGTVYESNWACPHPWNTSFFVNGFAEGGSGGSGSVFVTLGNDGSSPGSAGGTGGYLYSNANRRGTSAGPNSTSGSGKGNEGGINGDVSGANEGMFPFPNSPHSGGINCLMCDGAVRFIPDSIDARIWSRLVTPNGSRLVAPATGTLNSTAQEDPGTGIGFTQEPLKEDVL
jgi:prepilin-type N-terminal cleavage/methylation domain-containing protein/prepilin-type processing-associated H-X9-DG protein